MKCQTVFPDASSISTPNAIILTVVNCLVLLSNVFANGLLLYSIHKRRLLKSVSYTFILALIVCDLCVAVLCMPFTIATLYIKEDTDTSSSYCIIRLCTEFLAFLLCECSGILIMNVSIDRYLHMKHLQRYNSYMTPFRAKLMITTTWIFSAIIAMIFIISSLYGFLFIYHIVVLLVDLPVISANFVLYARAYFAIREKIKEMDLKASKNANDRADYIFARAVTLILVCIIACFSPYFALQTTWSYYKHFKNVTPNASLSVAVYWSILFIHISSLCNPVILILTDSETKTLVKNLFMKFCSCFYSKSETIDSENNKTKYGSAISLSNITTF